MDEQEQADELAAAKQKAKNAGVTSGGDNNDSAKSSPKQNKIKEGTGKLLKQFWLDIPASFGFTILFIDLFYLLWKILPDWFGKPGHEWVQAEIAKTSPEEAKKVGDKISLVENLGCCCVNIPGCFVLLLLIVIIYAMLHPVEFGWMALTGG
ncbi:MAG: hypothetical protein WCK37_00565 [Candidatus Falkowbacteria bacterium]